VTDDGEAGATRLDPGEASDLIPSSISTRGELDAFEQANILDAERWAFARVRKHVLDEAFIRGLHRRMFDQVWRWAGRYRKTDKNLGVAWPQVPAKVADLCADTRYWIDHRTYSWDELGTRFHHRLVVIHPFANGNGRHARLMTDVLLFSNGEPVFTWGRADPAKAGGARERYISALNAADRQDFAPLIAFARE
jgi:Fic-DOC domain mobile mystery protein B